MDEHEMRKWLNQEFSLGPINVAYFGENIRVTVRAENFRNGNISQGNMNSRCLNQFL